MQDTPEYPQLLARYQGYNLEQLINAAPPITDPNHVAVLRRAMDTTRQYFDESDFRATLTTTRKRNIEGQINNILAQLDQIPQFRANGSLAGNIESIITNIQSYLDEIDLRFTSPFQTYILQGRKDTASLVASIETARQETERARGTAEQKLKEADLLVGQGSDIKFSNLFQRLANGMTVEENELLQRKTRRERRTLIKVYAAIAVAVALILLLGADELMKAALHHSPAYYVRIAGLLVIPVLAGLAVFHNWLNETRPGGYERSAALWMVATGIAVVGTGIYAGVIILGLGPHPGWEDLVPKIVSLLAPAYFIRLCVRNYRASKHLAVLNTHRATVSQAVGGFAGRLETSETSLQADVLHFKGEMFLKAGSLIFDPGESGFISRSEGAGTSDNFFDENFPSLPQMK